MKNSKTHKVKIGSLERELPVIDIGEISIALFNMLGDVEITIEAARELMKKLPRNIDMIFTAEAKSIPLAYEMSRQLGVPYSIARKSRKKYMKNVLEGEIESITTKDVQKLYLSEKDQVNMKRKNVLIIDDVISTGSTLTGLRKLVELAEGNIVAEAAVFTEGENEKWKKEGIISLGNLPTFRND